MPHLGKGRAPAARWIIMGVVALAACGVGSPAQAQSAPQTPPLNFADDPDPNRPRAGESVVTLEEWRARFAGRTIHWREYGVFAGREHYSADGQSVVFIDVDGRCFEGTWRQLPGGRPGVLCFRYTGPGYSGEHCDLHLRQGERFYARRPSGSETEVIQTTDEVLSCRPEPIS